MGTVTAERPEAQRTGRGRSAAARARLMAWVAARVGAAFSISPSTPGLTGRALVPPSV
jgi:hypothetical protein